MSRICEVARRRRRGSRLITWTRLAALSSWFQRILARVLGGAGDAFAVLVTIITCAKDAIQDLPQDRVPHVSMRVGPAIVQTRWEEGNASERTWLQNPTPVLDFQPHLSGVSSAAESSRWSLRHLWDWAYWGWGLWKRSWPLWVWDGRAGPCSVLQSTDPPNASLAKRCNKTREVKHEQKTSLVTFFFFLSNLLLYINIF